MNAKGMFDVKLTPLTAPDAIPGRMSIDKQLHGDLEATSKGEMLMAGSPVKGSAGYVAIEQVSGTLHGREGTFLLQHNATMNRGAGELNIVVIPDSGTGALAGLSGTMSIVIARDGVHSYEFGYSLTNPPAEGESSGGR